MGSQASPGQSRNLKGTVLCRGLAGAFLEAGEVLPLRPADESPGACEKWPTHSHTASCGRGEKKMGSPGSLPSPHRCPLLPAAVSYDLSCRGQGGYHLEEKGGEDGSDGAAH